MKKVSVITCVYGVERYVERFARSFFGQTYPNIEFIVVNDGTTDASMSIIKGLLSGPFRHVRERVKIIDSINRGLPKARFLGLRNATGDYCLFADSDDWMEPDMVAKMVGKAEETGADFVYCDFVEERPDHDVAVCAKDYDASRKREWMDDIFRWKAFSYLWNVMFSMSICDRRTLMIPARQMNEDTLYFYQLLSKATSIAHVKEALYRYRILDCSMSKSRARRVQNRVGSSINFLDLRRLDEKQGLGLISPETSKRILVHCAWAALKFYRPLFEFYPEMREVGHLRLRLRGAIPLPKQILLKLYLLFAR